MSGDLEFPLLLAAYAELLPDALDPANPYPDTMLRQVVLQLLRAVGLPGAPVRRSNLKLQADLFTVPWHWGPVCPGVVAAGRYVQHPPQERDRIVEPLFFHHRVPGRDTPGA